MLSQVSGNENEKYDDQEKEKSVVLKFWRIVEGRILNIILKPYSPRQWAGIGRQRAFKAKIFEILLKYVENYAI